MTVTRGQGGQGGKERTAAMIVQIQQPKERRRKKKHTLQGAKSLLKVIPVPKIQS